MVIPAEVLSATKDFISYRTIQVLGRTEGNADKRPRVLPKEEMTKPRERILPRGYRQYSGW